VTFRIRLTLVKNKLKINCTKKVLIKMRVFTFRKSYLLLLLILLVFITFISIFVIVQTYVFETSIARYALIKPKEHPHLKDKQIILFWTGFFDIPYWSMPNETNDENYLKSLNCLFTNCVLTHDKNYLDETQMYDALVFHGAENWLMLDLPKVRSPKQLYIAAMLE
jgi:hypothetical protein